MTILSIEQLLADGGELARISKECLMDLDTARKFCARLGGLPQVQVWRICEAARTEEKRREEKQRRKGR